MSINQFIIDPKQLSKDALDSIIENFVLREGTDYGLNECDLEKKKSHVLKQLSSKQVLILYDDELGSCNLISALEAKTLSLNEPSS